jgi:hypothetical protein
VPGPSVVVRILGDLTGLGKSFSDAGDKGQGAASKMHSAFSGVLGTLNSTGVLGPFSGMLDGINGALDGVANHAKGIGPAMAGIGAGLVGVGTGLTMMGDKDKAAHQQLQQAVENTGHSYDDYAGKIEQAIKHQEKFGNTANTTQDALRILTQATGDPAKALQYLGEASDLAAAKHESLDSAAQQLAKTYGGSSRLLKEFGITAAANVNPQNALHSATTALTAAQDASAKAHQHLADLQAVLGSKGHLTAGQQMELKTAQDNVQAADAKLQDAHNKLTAAQQAAAGGAKGHGAALDELAQKLKGQAAAQSDTFTGKLKAMKAEAEDMAAKFGAKFGPAIQIFGVVMATAGSISAAGWLWIIAIVAAVAALIAIAILLSKYWHDIWGGIKDIIGDVWNWIKNNWPLLLGILTGPVGLAVGELIQHFATIKQWAKDAVDFIRKGWDDLVGFFTSLPGRIESVLEHMWDFIWDTFRAVINKLIDGWNSLQFKTPEIHVGPIHIGGETIGVPKIPELASGGIVTGPTLALLGEAGPEMVTPLGQGGGGPLVQINGSTFNSATDVDMIAKKLELATRAGLRLS